MKPELALNPGFLQNEEINFAEIQSSLSEREVTCVQRDSGAGENFLLEQSRLAGCRGCRSAG